MAGGRWNANAAVPVNIGVTIARGLRVRMGWRVGLTVRMETGMLQMRDGIGFVFQAAVQLGLLGT